MKNLKILFAIGLSVTMVACTTDDHTHEACEKVKVFVANMGDTPGTVSVIDTCSNTETKKITVGGSPTIWEYDETNERLFVGNNSGKTVSVINVETQAVVATLSVGNNPAGIDVDSTRKIVYVTNTDDGTVSVFKTTDNLTYTEDVNSPISVGTGPHKVAVNTTTGMAYVIMDQTYAYSIDGTNLALPATQIDLTDGGTGTPTLRRIKYNEVDGKLYVTRAHSDGFDRVAIINPSLASDHADYVTLVKVGEGAGRMDIDVVGNVYTANSTGDSVTVVDSTGLTANTVTLTTGIKPDDVKVNGAGTTVYVSNRGATNDGNTVSAITVANNTKADITVGTNPVNMDLSETLHRLYVANRGTNDNGTTISVINTETNTVVGTVTVGTNPRGLRVVELEHDE